MAIVPEDIEAALIVGEGEGAAATAAVGSADGEIAADERKPLWRLGAVELNDRR